MQPVGQQTPQIPANERGKHLLTAFGKTGNWYFFNRTDVPGGASSIWEMVVMYKPHLPDGLAGREMQQLPAAEAETVTARTEQAAAAGLRKRKSVKPDPQSS